MYEFESLDNNLIFYFRDSLNAPKEYINFLEELDNNLESHFVIPKWDKWKASNDESNIYGEQKYIKEFNSLNNELLNRKTLYIINSIKETLYMFIS